MAYIGTPPANRPLTSFEIGENNITSFNISEAVIETLDIVNSSVTEAKLADSSVTEAKLATNYVGNVTAGTGLILVGNTYTITNSGMAAYTIDGSSNPSLTLFRGHTYTFNVSASGHPFWIKTANVIGTGSAYSTGVTNNGTESGTITFTVPSNAPATLYYQCQAHLPMYGTINVSNVSKNAKITIGVADSGNVTVSQLPLSGATAGTYGNAITVPTVTVNSKGLVTAVSNVAITLPSGGFSNMAVFTSDTTWTIPAGITKIKATLVGGGGAGGSATYVTDGNGGAGVGSYLTSGTQTITQIYAGPGIGGAPGGTTPQGAGGNATGGDLNIKGSPGLSAQVAGQTNAVSGGVAVTFNSGEGGSSTLGGGMPPVFATNNGISATGINLSYGGGGSGGAQSSQGAGQGGGGGSTAIKYLTGLTPGLTLTVDVGTGGIASTTETRNGGNGGPGVVIIEY